MENEPDKLKFKDLLSEFSKQRIRIPEFQRNFVWNKTQIKKLLDSIYNQYPIGSFIFWISTEEINCVTRAGNYIFDELPPKGYPISYVIDGQQRILSLITAIKAATIDDKTYSFYFDLVDKKFLEESEISIQSDKYVPLPKLFLESAEYSEFIDNFDKSQKLILNDLYLRFNNYLFSTIKVKNEDSLKKICDVFHVINTTGKKLSPVALIISKCWSEGFDLRKKLNEMHNKFKSWGEIPEYRILQLASVLTHDKKCKKDIIVNHLTVSEIKDSWENMIKSLELSIDFLKTKLRVKNIRYMPFDVILVPLAYFYYKNNLTPEDNTQKEHLKKWFWTVGLSRKYDSAVEGRLEKDLEVFDKIISGNTPVFSYNIAIDNLKENIIAEKFSFGSAFCKTILSLFSYNKPLGFSDGEAVEFESYSNLNRKNLHHIFPQNYIKKHLPNEVEYTNKVTNSYLQYRI